MPVLNSLQTDPSRYTRCTIDDNVVDDDVDDDHVNDDAVMVLLMMQV